MVLPLVAGYFLARPSDSGSTDEIMAEAGFNHPEKYGQINEGKGTNGLITAVGQWRRDIATQFDEIKQLLDDANSAAGVTWSGQAAEAHGETLKPMTQFVEDAKSVSTGVGDSAERQVENFSQVKNSMPEPVKVDATDSYLEKGAAAVFGQETDLQKQEAQATAKAEEAKRYYDNYDSSSRDVSSGLPQYPKAPEMAYDAGGGPGQGGSVQGTVNPGGGGSAQPVGGGSGSGLTGGSGAGFSGAGSGSGDAGSGGLTPGGSSGAPAGSDSAWAHPGGPGTGGGPGPGAGAGSGTGAGPGAGAGSGAGYMPGGMSGSGGGSGAGRGAGGAGSGAGRGGLGAGGRAGGGLFGGGAAAGGKAGGAGGRGGAGMMGGAGARGRGQEGDEDDEHENKYMLPTDEAWEELGLPRVAPAVFGEWNDESR